MTKTAFAIFATAAALALFALNAPAKATDVLTITPTGRGGVVIYGGRLPSAEPHVIHVAPDLGPEAEDRIRRWTAYCQPRPVTDRYGVDRLMYAKPGCEFGRDHD